MLNTPASFNKSKNVGNYIYIDEKSKKWTIPQGLFLKNIVSTKIHSYNDIVDFELLEDGNSISKGGLGRAIIGGALAGGIGAIVGGTTGKRKNKQTCTKLQIKITLNNINTPVEYITLINYEIKKDSITYKSAVKNAQEIISLLQVMCNASKSPNVSEPPKNNQLVSNIDEIKKYKQLLDIGAITQEEFEIKKKQLLNL